MDSRTPEHPKRKRGAEGSEESLTVQRRLPKNTRFHPRNDRPWRVVASTKTAATIKVTALGQTRTADLHLTNGRWQAADLDLLDMGVSSTIRASVILKLAHILKRFCISDAAATARVLHGHKRFYQPAGFWEH